MSNDWQNHPIFLAVAQNHLEKVLKFLLEDNDTVKDMLENINVVFP
jgi:molybdopterin-guanine dinucleotide biosynthesis protein A